MHGSLPTNISDDSGYMGVRVHVHAQCTYIVHVQCDAMMCFIQLAENYDSLFFEASAKTGYNCSKV